jgi:hypothetical protein
MWAPILATSASPTGQQGPRKGAFAYPRELECRASLADRSRLGSHQIQGPADCVSDRLGDRLGRARLGPRAYNRNVANAITRRTPVGGRMSIVRGRRLRRIPVGESERPGLTLKSWLLAELTLCSRSELAQLVAACVATRCVLNRGGSDESYASPVGTCRELPKGFAQV